MWRCNKCGRVFERTKQQHSCKLIPLEQHFVNKAIAKKLFDYLLIQISEKIGKYEIISLPCCVHIFGHYDFLAILPHKDKLEIRFASDNMIISPRIIQSVNLSQKLIKVCIDIKNVEEIDTELLKWLKSSYSLKSI